MKWSTNYSIISIKKNRTEVGTRIIAGLNACLRGQEPPEIEILVSQASNHLKEAYQEQKSLGRGFF